MRDMSSDVYIVPEARLVNDIKAQFPELDDEHLIIEPGLRGTASCYILALDTISRKHATDDPIAFIWADHHVRDIAGFQDSFQQAAAIAVSQNRLVTIGIEPTYPAPLGYIERGDEVEGTGVYNVVSFKEKPDIAVANQYIQQGSYLWNSGYYIGTTDAFLESMQKFAPELYEEYEELHEKEIGSEEYNQAYFTFTNTTIDVGLSEKMDNLLVVPARFDWLDIGNFKDLHEASEKDATENYQEGENVHVVDTENSYVRNDEKSKPVAVIGLDNVVVVNTPEGILVARKDVAHKVGDIAKKIQG